MHGIRYSLLISLCCLTSGTATGQDFSLVPGTVISHSPQSSGKYIGSPSIAILPNGDYVASHDFFGPNSNQGVSATSQVFRSTDQGETWTLQATLGGQFWSNLFVLDDDLYLMGTDKEYGRIVIRRSTDGGANWTTPTSASTGRLTSVSAYHTAPMPMVVHEGRIWRAFEDINAGGGWPAHFRSFVMSAPVDADLLDASSWTLSNALARDTDWLNGKFNGWLEGNVVLDPNGELVNVLRVDNQPAAAIVNVDSASHTVSFDPESGFVEFPGGAKKFAIRYDDVTQKYWALSSPVLPQHQGSSDGGTRNALGMMSSSDLKAWDTEAVLLYHPDIANHAFQYPDWQFDGDDMIIASRTAYDDGLGGANRAHDANFLTFHRVADFRTFNPAHVLVADTNTDRVLRYQTLPGEEWIPLGTFASGVFAGEALDNPMGLVQDSRGYVYVGEQKDGGRILRFDAGGNFLDVVAREGVDFVGRPEALTISPNGKLFMSVAFGADSDRIYKIDAETNATTLFVDTTFTGGSLNNPRGLAIAADGNLYVADRQSGQVRKFDGETGTFLGNLFTQSTPQGIVWNEATQAFTVSALGSNNLFSVDLAGNVTNAYSLGGNGAALGLVAIDGVVYWSDYNNGKVYALTGVDQRQEVATALSGPGHLLQVAKPRERGWLLNNAGNWHDSSNWQAFWGIPNSTEEIAVFGAALSSNRTVILDRDETVGGIRFASTFSYAIAGNGTLHLGGDGSEAFIDVYAGSHQLQVEVSLDGDVQMHMQSGTTLTVQNVLRLNGHNLQKTGAGDLVFNGLVDASGGQVLVEGGMISGSGNLVGSLVNSNGTIAPGNSPGRLSIQGDFQQHAAGILQLEIGGQEDSNYDVLAVSGELAAGGLLEVVLANHFSPSLGDRFDVLQFATASGAFDRYRLPNLAAGLQWDVSQLLAARGGYLTVVAQVPEPSGWLIACGAIIGSRTLCVTRLARSTLVDGAILSITSPANFSQVRRS